MIRHYADYYYRHSPLSFRHYCQITFRCAHAAFHALSLCHYFRRHFALCLSVSIRYYFVPGAAMSAQTMPSCRHDASAAMPDTGLKTPMHAH